MRWLQKIFMYLDRYFYKNVESSLIKKGFGILKKRVIDPHADNLFKCIVHELNRKRNEEFINEENVKRAIKVYEITS